MENRDTETVDLSTADNSFMDKIAERFPEGSLKACFSCKTCASSCPVTLVDESFNPLKIIRMVLYGLKGELLGSHFIWLCSSCYACQERCPKGVKITDFIISLKNMAVQEGNAPAGIRAQEDLIINNGKIYPLDDFDNKKRVKIDLPELPTTYDSVRMLFQED